jgi:hypothetical protein
MFRNPIASTNSPAVIAHRYNTRAYRTYWHEYGVQHFITVATVLCYVRVMKQQKHSHISTQVASAFAYSHITIYLNPLIFHFHIIPRQKDEAKSLCAL